MRVYLTEREFDEVMLEMFEAVGEKFYSIKRSCKGDKWFTKHSWSMAEEKKFKAWLKAYLIRKLDVHETRAEKMAAMFLFDYGWKYSKE